MLTDSERHGALAANRALKWLPRPIVRLIVDAGRFAMVMLAARVLEDGFRILDSNTTPGSQDRIQKVTDALNMLRRISPRRAASIQGRASRIFVFPTTGTDGEYWRKPRAVVLNRSFVERASPEELLLVIVHEATHARLMDRGIPYSASIRHRVEQACIREEIRTASLLGSAEAWVARVRNKNATPDFWSDEAARKRKELAFMEMTSDQAPGLELSPKPAEPDNAENE